MSPSPPLDGQTAPQKPGSRVEPASRIPAKRIRPQALTHSLYYRIDNIGLPEPPARRIVHRALFSFWPPMTASVIERVPLDRALLESLRQRLGDRLSTSAA